MELWIVIAGIAVLWLGVCAVVVGVCVSAKRGDRDAALRDAARPPAVPYDTVRPAATRHAEDGSRTPLPL